MQVIILFRGNLRVLELCVAKKEVILPPDSFVFSFYCHARTSFASIK